MQRETQLRETFAVDTHLIIARRMSRDARAIDSR